MFGRVLNASICFPWNLRTTSSHRKCSIKKGVPRNFSKFTGQHLCQGFFFNKVAGLPKACNYIKKETVPQMFCCEFCEIKNAFFTEHLWSTASREHWICKPPVNQSSTHQSLLIRRVQIKWRLENNLNYNNLNNLHDQKYSLNDLIIKDRRYWNKNNKKTTEYQYPFDSRWNRFYIYPDVLHK